MKPKTKLGVSWLRVGYILVAAVAMYVLVSQLSSFRGSISQLKASNRADDLVVLIGVVITYLLAGLTYYYIALKPIRYLRTVAVETGINTLNRLLPAGLGGIGGNYVYLMKSKHTEAQSGAVVAANTVLGVIANLILLSLLLVYFPARRFKYSSLSPHLVLVSSLVVLIIIGAVLLIKPLRRRFAHNAKLILKNLLNYRFLKLRLLYGLICQIGLTLAFVVAFDYSLKAVGGSLSFGSIMLTYSFAIWLGAVIPAPGGVGSVEAGLVAGLLAFKVDLVQAVAAVLIFRLVSFWLPLIGGVVPLYWSYKNNYL